MRRMFPGVELEPEDLYYLEPFQLEYLPGWIPGTDLARLVGAYPGIGSFMGRRCPAMEAFLEGAMREGPVEKGDPEEAFQRALWSIADMIVYGKCPEVYDALEFHGWDFSEVTSIVPLDGLRVIDAGSGTGRVALEAALTAEEVWAVEPVGRLREFIMERCLEEGIGNIHVVDGFLHRMPFPDGFADLLITSHALGWRIHEELPEMERVVREGGHIIHCPGTSLLEGDSHVHRTLTSSAWGYACAIYEESDGSKRKYWKTPRASGRAIEQGGHDPTWLSERR